MSPSAYKNVTFSSRGRAGVRLSDVLAASVAGATSIDSPNDIVMADVEGKKTKIAITWPAYPASDELVVQLQPGPTRSALALLIARAYAAYFSKITNMSCYIEYSHLRVASNAVTLRNLSMHELFWNDEKKTWQVGIQLV